MKDCTDLKRGKQEKSVMLRRNRMTKLEAYKRVFGKEAIHIEGIDWDSEVDDAFEMELEVIKQMVERMQNESSISD